jgi:phage terminase large subunit-like protein
MGMKYGIIDDPVKNRQDANSPTIRNGLWDWYTSTFRTRLAPGGGILLTVTTWHEDGLEARLLKLARENPKADQWTVLRLPAIAEVPVADYDIRQPGEALWPSQYDLDDLEATKVSSGDYDWSALYQQSPKPDGGAIFKKECWDIATGRNRYDLEDEPIRNKVIARWLMFDTAFKDKATNDPSACTVWELWPDYRLAVRAMWEQKIDSAFLPSKIQEMATKWNYDGKLQSVVIEDKGSGTTTISTLRMSAPAWLAEKIVEFMPNGTKEYRARLSSVWCEKDCVMLPWSGPEWYPSFLDPETGQLWMFPNATHDDMVDTFTMGILYLENFIKEGWHARQGKQGQ